MSCSEASVVPLKKDVMFGVDLDGTLQLSWRPSGI